MRVTYVLSWLIFFKAIIELLAGLLPDFVPGRRFLALRNQAQPAIGADILEGVEV